jgi:hypothetical protein
MKSEDIVSDEVRLFIGKLGWKTWRNNVGCLPGHGGAPVRYGLANESKKQNKLVKSADLIGVIPMLIEQHHVGMTIGRFLSLETKKEGWKFNPNDAHQAAQANWINIVNGLGGYAKFVQSTEDILS